MTGQVIIGTALILLLVVEAREPGCEELHGSLELGMKIDKRAQLVRKPGKRDLILAAPHLELLDASISEVHTCSYARLAHGALVLLPSSLFAQRSRGQFDPLSRWAFTGGIALIVPPITSARLRRSPRIPRLGSRTAR